MIDVDTYKDQFEVFKDGETTELPKVGDLMVWEEFPNAGHVGIVTDVDIDNQKVKIYNGNSTSLFHIFRYELSTDNRVKLLSSGNWKPDYWVRRN